MAQRALSPTPSSSPTPIATPVSATDPCRTCCACARGPNALLFYFFSYEWKCHWQMCRGYLQQDTRHKTWSFTSHDQQQQRQQQQHQQLGPKQKTRSAKGWTIGGLWLAYGQFSWLTGGAGALSVALLTFLRSWLCCSWVRTCPGHSPLIQAAAAFVLRARSCLSLPCCLSYNYYDSAV